MWQRWVQVPVGVLPENAEIFPLSTGKPWTPTAHRVRNKIYLKHFLYHETKLFIDCLYLQSYRGHAYASGRSNSFFQFLFQYRTLSAHDDMTFGAMLTRAILVSQLTPVRGIRQHESGKCFCVAMSMHL